MTRRSEPERIDAPLMRGLLSPEEVTSGDLQNIAFMLDNLLETNGTKSTVNGVPARVSVVEVETPIPGEADQEEQIYWARVFRLDKRDENGKEVRGLVFGETPGLPVLTPNPFAVRLSTNYKGGPSLVVDNYIDPIVDDPVYVEFAKKVLKALNAKAEQAEAEKRRLAEEARQERRNRREYVLARAKEVGLDALKWSGVGIGVGVLTFGVTKVVELPKDFDDRDIELPSEGTVLSLGEKGAPAYSSEAYENPDLRPDNVPDLTDYSGSTSADTVLNDDNLIREVWLTSSKKGQNCEVRDIEEHLPLGTTLEAWTDFMAPTGQSRADELEVAYESDKVTICWVKGQELNADDDPRVLIRLRVPQEQQSS